MMNSQSRFRQFSKVNFFGSENRASQTKSLSGNLINRCHLLIRLSEKPSDLTDVIFLFGNLEHISKGV
jgi:hypothetical protein